MWAQPWERGRPRPPLDAPALRGRGNGVTSKVLTYRGGLDCSRHCLASSASGFRRAGTLPSTGAGAASSTSARTMTGDGSSAAMRDRVPPMTASLRLARKSPATAGPTVADASRVARGELLGALGRVSHRGAEAQGLNAHIPASLRFHPTSSVCRNRRLASGRRRWPGSGLGRRRIDARRPREPAWDGLMPWFLG